MTHILGERLKELTEDVDREEELKDIAKANMKEKGKAIEAVEKKAQSSEKGRLLAKKKIVEVEGQLEGVELKLAEANNLNLAQADQVADLKAAHEARENKWYDERFTDAKKSVEPVVHQA